MNMENPEEKKEGEADSSDASASELSAKEVYEQKKKERDSQKEKGQQSKERKGSFKRIRLIVIGVGILAAFGYGIYVIAKASKPVEPDQSKAVTIMDSRNHIPVGSALPEYTSNPPTSGPHYGQTARSGFRGDDDLADQNIIHSLEHGDVWISYHPRVSEDIVKQLRKLGGSKIIVTKREANDTDIAVVSWGRIDTFNIENNTLPKTRINDFIKRHLNNGPERITTPTGGI